MSSYTGTLYTGVTSNLEKRVYEHKHKLVEGFTSRYDVNRLVYYEDFGSVWDALAREKEIEGWVRVKKVALIRSVNPRWEDLSAGWYDEES
jgi:putative endonuclease